MLRARLPESLVSDIDWSTLEPEPASFVNNELAALHGDLLYSAQLGDARLLMYLLFEHRSEGARDQPFRLLHYTVLIWHQHRQTVRATKQGDPDRLPLVLAVLFSHANDGWKGPLSLADMLEPHPDTRPEIAPYLPSFQVFLQDVRSLSDAELRSLALDAVSRTALMLLRDARDAVARVAKRAEWFRQFREVLREADGVDVMHAIFRYLDAVFGPEKFKDFSAEMQQAIPETIPVMRTYAQELIEQGLEQGLERGLEQGLEQGRCEVQRTSLVDVLELRGFTVTAEQRARIEACASLETLQRWYTAAKTVSLDTPVDRVLADAT